jgi:hypothetical protein
MEDERWKMKGKGQIRWLKLGGWRRLNMRKTR